jgi:hypothetical protein
MRAGRKPGVAANHRAGVGALRPASSALSQGRLRARKGGILAADYR